MTKHNLLFCFFGLGCLAFSSLLGGCDKDDDHADGRPPFLGVEWKASDVNPHPEKTSPEQLPVQWPDCSLDDVFIFGKDKRLHIDFGDIDCDNAQNSVLSSLQNGGFSYDEENQKLTTADGAAIRIAYLSETSLKLAVLIPSANGYSELVFFFEKE